jgi:hypothetical protein
MEHVNLIGQLLVWAVVSVVPAFFLFLFASSSYRELKRLRATWIQAEQRLKSAPAPQPPELLAECRTAREAYRNRRRTFWGAVWGTVCRLPPA